MRCERGNNMSMKIIDELKEKLESILQDEKVDKDEVLKLSTQLDQYIVEYMRNSMLSKINPDNIGNDNLQK